MKDYEKFAEQLKTNNALQKEYVAFMEAKNPQTDEATYAAIIEFAAVKGYSFTVEDIAAARTDVRKLDENERMLAQGGEAFKCSDGYNSCSNGFTPGEWCWWNELCDTIVRGYKRSPWCSSTDKD